MIMACMYCVCMYNVYIFPKFGKHIICSWKNNFQKINMFIQLYSRILIIWWRTVFLFIQNNEKQQNDTSLKTSTSLEQQGNSYPKNSSSFEKNSKPSLVTKNLT